VTALLVVTRAVHFASLMLIFGGSAYAALLRHRKLDEPGAGSLRNLFATAASLALISGIVWFCLIAGQMSGAWQGSFDPAILELAATATRFGHIFLARLIGMIGLSAVCILRRGAKPLIVAILSGLLLASLAPISHAAATGGEIAVLGATNDAVHLLAAGFWLGGLVVLALLICRCSTDATALIGPLRIFSIWGAAVVALLVSSGVINAFSILPLSAMSLHNSYFDLLLVKVGLAAVMVGLASLNRWRFAPALPSGGDQQVRHLARSVGLEIALGFLVVAIVGYLGTMAPH
jgi:copper resistance protein D